MPRPRKYRHVCHFPQTLAFSPDGNTEGMRPVILSIDEYEAIRLIDREGFSQEQCAAMTAVRGRLEELRSREGEKCRENCRLCRVLSLSGGGFLVILLI